MKADRHQVRHGAGIPTTRQPAFSNIKEVPLSIVDLVLVAMFVEAVVSALKPIWDPVDGKRLTVAELVSMSVGVVLAVSSKINMLEALVKIQAPGWVQYLFYVMTGIALGRGPSFLYDLWTRIKSWQGEEIPIGQLMTAGGLVDLDIANWGLMQLRDFCAANDIPCAECVTREDYIRAIEGFGAQEETEPPEKGGAE